MSDFLSEYCEHGGGTKCKCMNRVTYAQRQQRIDLTLPYSSSLVPENIANSKLAMENIDAATALYANMCRHCSKEQTKDFLFDLINTSDFSSITK